MSSSQRLRLFRQEKSRAVNPDATLFRPAPFKNLSTWTSVMQLVESRESSISTRKSASTSTSRFLPLSVKTHNPSR